MLKGTGSIKVSDDELLDMAARGNALAMMIERLNELQRKRDERLKQYLSEDLFRPVLVDQYGHPLNWKD